MPRDGSGIYSRTDGTRAGASTWTNARDASVSVNAPDHDTHDEDMVSAINDCLTQDNLIKPTANFLPNLTATYDLGSSSAKWRHAYLSGNADVAGALSVGGNVTGTFRNTGTVKWAKGADIASATALTLGSDGNYFDVTGTTAITSINTVGVGTVIKLHFDAALTLTHHATNLDLKNNGSNITTAAGDEAELIEYASGQWRLTNYSKANGVPVWIPRAYLSGLLCSNGTDTDHDIDIDVGQAADSTNTFLLFNSSTLTKQIDAAWVAGTNQGGMFTGTVAADTTYHLFLIRKDSDGTIDAGFDTSVTAANIPAGYSAYRRIMSLKTDASANIRGFYNRGDSFLYKTYIEDVNKTITTTATNETLSIPVGGFGAYILAAGTYAATASGIYVYSPIEDAKTPASGSGNLIVSSTSTRATIDTLIYTNSTGQIAHDSSSNDGTLVITTKGYLDYNRAKGV